MHQIKQRSQIMDTRETIEKLITQNKGNKKFLDDTNPRISGYRKGYYEDYHDALVDLLNELGYPCEHEIYCD